MENILPQPYGQPFWVQLNLKHGKLTDVVEQTRNVSTWSEMCSRDTKIKRTLLESGLGLLTKEYEKNTSYGRTIKYAR